MLKGCLMNGREEDVAGLGEVLVESLGKSDKVLNVFVKLTLAAELLFNEYH